MIDQQRIPQFGKWRTSTQRWRRPRRPPWPWSPTTTVPETPLPFRSSSSQSQSPPPPSSTATKINDNTKIEIPEQKQKQKNHIYVKQTKRSMAASLVEISRVSNFSKPWNFETTKHKKFSEREKDSQGLKGLDRWRGWKNWLMIIKFTTSWRKCPPICYVISVLLY